jgi:hypothetical protein
VSIHPELGRYRLSSLRAGMCRFACTPHSAPASEHRFCGATVANTATGEPTSWCPHHTRIVFAPGTRSERRATDWDAIKRFV